MHIVGSFFDRLAQGSVLDLPLSQQEHLWCVMKLLGFKYCTHSLAFELRVAWTNPI